MKRYHSITAHLLLLILVLMGSVNCSPLAKKPGNTSTASNDTTLNAPPQQKVTAAGECPLSFNNLDLCASLESNVGQIKTEGSSFGLKFWRKELGTLKNGPFIHPGYTVCVKPWMIMENGHQHGSFDTDPIHILFDDVHGTFTVEPVFFSMEGKWQMLIQLCTGEVQCKDDGYGGCPGGKVFDQTYSSFDVHVQ